jgi:hypothetical protein
MIKVNQISFFLKNRRNRIPISNGKGMLIFPQVSVGFRARMFLSNFQALINNV